MTDLHPSSTGSGIQNDPFLRIRADKVIQLLDLVGELGLAAATLLHHPALAGLGLGLDGFQNDIFKVLIAANLEAMQETTDKVIVIGASAG